MRKTTKTAEFNYWYCVIKTTASYILLLS